MNARLVPELGTYDDDPRWVRHTLLQRQPGQWQPGLTGGPAGGDWKS